MAHPRAAEGGKTVSPVARDTPYAEARTLSALRQRLFANWRWALRGGPRSCSTVLPWLSWNDRQAVLFHLTERKFYIFGWVFWPQDSLLPRDPADHLRLRPVLLHRDRRPAVVRLRLSADGGPRSSSWIERKIEGDHTRRQKLDRAPMAPEKEPAPQAASSSSGASSRCGPASPSSPTSRRSTEFLASFNGLTFGPWETFWILFYGGFTYLFAGVLREQVCIYMCPYARFQAVMFDPDTGDHLRRGPRRAARHAQEGRSIRARCPRATASTAASASRLPDRIDIRDGLQYECIGCAPASTPATRSWTR